MRKILAVGILCTVGGCDLMPITEVMAVRPSTYHTVAYYDANPIEQASAKAWCDNNPGLASKIPSCDSADVSGIHAFHHQMGWN